MKKVRYCTIEKLEDKEKSELINLLIQDFKKDFPDIEPQGIYFAQAIKPNNYTILKKYFNLARGFNINKKVFKKYFSAALMLYYTLYSFRYKKFLIYKIVMGRKMLGKLIYNFQKKEIEKENNYIPVKFYILHLKKSKNLNTTKIIIKEYQVNINEEVESILRNNKNTISENLKQGKSIK